MKKLMKKISDYNPQKKVALLYLLIPIVLNIIRSTIIDNDIWFVLNTGKTILEKGFINIDVFTIHSNLSYIPQQWLSAVIFYNIYKIFDVVGLSLIVILCNLFIMFLIYRIVMLITNNKYNLAVFSTIVSVTLLNLFSMITQRPQIFSLIIILIELHVLELYIKKKKFKYLLILPLLSTCIVNMHASNYIMIYLICLPYLIEGFVTKKYKVLPIIGVMLFMFIFGLINPYGLDACMYSYNSFSNLINSYVIEMSPVVITNVYGKIILMYIFLIGMFIYKAKHVNIRFSLLMLGTLYITMNHIRGLIYFAPISMISVAYFLSFNYNNPKVIKEDKVYKKAYNLLLITCLVIGTFISIIGVYKYNAFTPKLEKAADYLLDKESIDNIKISNSYNTGGYLEFRGIKTYIDQRAEVFLKSKNKQTDIFNEYYNILLKQDDDTIEKYINKYNFNYFLEEKDNEFINEYLKENDYPIIYEDKYYIIYKNKDNL